jgi:hypothetical protein
MSHRICMGNIERGPRRPISMCPFCKHRRYTSNDPKCSCRYLKTVGFINRAMRRREEALVGRGQL